MIQGFFEEYNSGNIDTGFDYVPDGGKYDCAKQVIIKLCSLSSVYTFYDHTETDQYITDTAKERNLEQNGFCGHSMAINRVHNVNYANNWVDRLLANKVSTTIYVNQNNNNPKVFKNNFYNDYFFAWPSNTTNINENIEGRKNLYNQTVDGKLIDRSRVCIGDLSDKLTIRNDTPLDGEVILPPLPTIDYVDEGC
uniref:NosD domain-containing protein n=1 Tax=Strongyloides venezuelensis TaxID=75913 RepID=A0A0K0G489_STRVS